MRWTRAPRYPAWLASFVRGSLLTAAEVDGGAWLALGRHYFTLVSETGVQWQRPWHEVERGDWDGEAHTLTITWVGDPTPGVLTTADEHPRELPVIFRERVEASVVHTETVPALGGGTLRAAVRRAPDGSLLTQIIGVGRVRPGPELDVQMDALDARVRDAVGLSRRM